MTRFREEQDSLGTVRVPAEALYQAQTQRAVDNFPVSGLRMPRRFINAVLMIKRAAAETNRELGDLDGAIAEAIIDSVSSIAPGMTPFRWTSSRRAPAPAPI